MLTPPPPPPPLPLTLATAVWAWGCLACRFLFSMQNTGVEGGETAVKLARRWGYDVKGVEEVIHAIFSFFLSSRRLQTAANTEYLKLPPPSRCCVHSICFTRYHLFHQTRSIKNICREHLVSYTTPPYPTHFAKILFILQTTQPHTRSILGEASQGEFKAKGCCVRSTPFWPFLPS